ncbi:MAG: hypothetical protein ACP5KY_05050, partial [Thermoproteus sp.]
PRPVAARSPLRGSIRQLLHRPHSVNTIASQLTREPAVLFAEDVGEEAPGGDGRQEESATQAPRRADADQAASAKTADRAAERGLRPAPALARRGSKS